MSGTATTHHPSTVPPEPRRPTGWRRRREGLIELLAAIAVLAFGVAVYLGQSEATGWSAFRITVVLFAAVFGLGFLARAIRAFVQQRRFARIAEIPPQEP